MAFAGLSMVPFQGKNEIKSKIFLLLINQRPCGVCVLSLIRSLNNKEICGNNISATVLSSSIIFHFTQKTEPANLPVIITLKNK